MAIFKVASGMKCHICGEDTAFVRKEELPIAVITGRAHIDCGGHSQYRQLSREEYAQVCLEEENHGLLHRN